MKDCTAPPTTPRSRVTSSHALPLPAARIAEGAPWILIADFFLTKMLLV
jgi:hypothetical protein